MSISDFFVGKSNITNSLWQNHLVHQIFLKKTLQCIFIFALKRAGTCDCTFTVHLQILLIGVFSGISCKDQSCLSTSVWNHYGITHLFHQNSRMLYSHCSLLALVWDGKTQKKTNTHTHTHTHIIVDNSESHLAPLPQEL